MVKLSKEWNPPRNLSDEEFEDLQNLSKNINLSDKRNKKKIIQQKLSNYS